MQEKHVVMTGYVSHTLLQLTYNDNLNTGCPRKSIIIVNIDKSTQLHSNPIRLTRKSLDDNSYHFKHTHFVGMFFGTP